MKEPSSQANCLRRPSFNDTALDDDALLAIVMRNRHHKSSHRDDDFDDRLRRCWRLQTCGSCLSSDAKCGWCPYSSTCIPLPASTPTGPLSIFAPLHHAHICPLPDERWELRTKAFGRESCNVSTRTTLAVLVSFLCGIALCVVLYSLFVVGRWCWGRWKASRGGWEVLVLDDGSRRERVWVRRKGKGKGWMGRLLWGSDEEDLVVDGEGGRRSWWWTSPSAAGGGAARTDDTAGERRPLLGN